MILLFSTPAQRARRGHVALGVMAALSSQSCCVIGLVAAVDRRAEGLAAPPEGGGTSVGTYGGDRRYFRVGGYHSAVAAVAADD